MPRKVRYKVVKRRTRNSAVINGNSRYSIKYEKGADVFAREETLGVFVFTNRRAAESWAWYIDRDHEDDEIIILRVLPIGKGKTPQRISPSIDTDVLNLFYNDEDYHYMNVPHDYTLCYPGVHVLD